MDTSDLHLRDSEVSNTSAVAAVASDAVDGEDVVVAVGDEVVEEVGILDLDRVAYETCRYR